MCEENVFDFNHILRLLLNNSAISLDVDENKNELNNTKGHEIEHALCVSGEYFYKKRSARLRHKNPDMHPFQLYV